MSCPRQSLVQYHSQAPDTFLKLFRSAHKLDRITVHISIHSSYSPACPQTDHLRLLSSQQSPKNNGSQISVDALHSPSHFIRRETQVEYRKEQWSSNRSLGHTSCNSFLRRIFFTKSHLLHPTVKVAWSGFHNV
jgi:hypothetical protein